MKIFKLFEFRAKTEIDKEEYLKKLISTYGDDFDFSNIEVDDDDGYILIDNIYCKKHDRKFYYFSGSRKFGCPLCIE